MNPKSQKLQMGLVIAVVVLGVAVLAESFLRPRTDADAAKAPPTPPAGARDPASEAYRPSEEAWTEYLKRRPLDVGAVAPVFAFTDKQKPPSTPLPGKPALWAVLCGCSDCADAGFQIFQILRDMGRDQVDGVLFVPNTANYVQDRMRQSFALRCRVVEDRNGTYFRRLRAPGNTYSHLPMVWGIDRGGRVAFFARPRRGKSLWTLDVQKKLGLKLPLEPPVD